ncbi:MAG TPA: hypothetical protein VKZ46_05295 [Pedomonas sp.]|nr:hypothetical protein [Pedomonas sp.]
MNAGTGGRPALAFTFLSGRACPGGPDRASMTIAGLFCGQNNFLGRE